MIWRRWLAWLGLSLLLAAVLLPWLLAACL